MVEEKSFLSILKREDKIVNQINGKKRDMLDFMQEYEKSSGECSDVYKRIYDQIAADVADLENDLTSVRTAMKYYINNIVENRMEKLL